MSTMLPKLGSLLLPCSTTCRGPNALLQHWSKNTPFVSVYQESYGCTLPISLSI
jgi:hypothetical protein